MKIMKITLLFAALLLVSLQQPTQGCKIRDSPHVVRGILECMLAKFLNLIPSQSSEHEAAQSGGWTAPRGLDSKPMQVNMLMHTFSRHLELVDQIAEAADEGAHMDAVAEMQSLLKDATLQRGLASFFQEFMKPSLHMERWLSELVSILGPEEAAEMLMFAEEYVDFSEFSNITSVICPVIANVTGWDFCATAKCLSKYDETDFEDNLRWGECVYTCQDLINISACVYDVVHTNCSRKPKLAPIMVRGFMGFFGFETTCLYSVKFDSALPPDGAIELYEGGPPVMVELRSYVPATVYCAQFGTLAEVISTVGYRIKQFFARGGDCQVQFQMSLSNYLTGILPVININTEDSPNLPGVCTSVHLANPKCRNNRLLTQALIGNHTHQSGASCLINITDDNWQNVHHFPLQATVDHKADRTINTNFTIKAVVKGIVSNTSKYLVSIHNRDVEEGEWSTCRSINDPHIITFDGTYYDNFLEGYFYLYRNKMLPYQVQVLYQNCDEAVANVTCACAVAVKSDDDVFVVDKCRRVGCVGDTCNAIRTVLYTTGRNLAAGTRIIENSQGLDYKVIMPHGTIVKIQVTLRQLNIHVIPSAYDRDSTEGLCGMFNVNATDDFTFPNGTILQAAGGPGFQPTEYSHAWRVPVTERAFDGVLQSPSPLIMSNYCSCRHIIIVGVKCQCGINKLVETCDIATEGELNSTQLLAIQRRSLSELRAANPDVTVASPMADVDVDEELRAPVVIPGWGGGRNFTEQEASRACRSAISDSVVGGACPRDSFNIMASSLCLDFATDVCIEDIRITDTTLWVQSAVELMKQCCQEEFDRRLHICISDLHSIENATCLNDCSNNGVCVRGHCECSSQWSGGDCSFSVTSPKQVTTNQTMMCDRRHENCQYIPFSGTSLHTVEDLHCTTLKLIVTSSGSTVDSSQASETAPVHVVNPYQATCLLSSADNYMVTVASAAGIHSTFKVLTTDLVCYRCDLTTGGCWRKTAADHCVIEGGCYEHLEADSRDNCSICNTTANVDGWTDRQDDYCTELRAAQKQEEEEEKKSNIVRAIVVTVLVVVIILLTIVIFCCQKNRAPVDQKTSNGNGVAKSAMALSSLSTGYLNGGATLTDQSQTSSQNHSRPPSILVSTVPPHMSPDERERTASVGSSGVNDLLRIKQLAAENQRDRANSIGQVSVRSLGIGAGGPIQYSRFTPNVTSGDTSSMDYLGIGGGHTIKHRSLSDADNLLTYQL